MEGTVVSINTRGMRPEGSPHLPFKLPASNGRLGQYGFRGDYHNQPTKRDFKNPGQTLPNTDRHVSVVALEVIDALNRELGLNMGPGTLGENLTVRGMGDLSAIADNVRLLIVGHSGAPICTLRVAEQNKPCKNLTLIHRELPKRIMGRRGLLCAIETYDWSLGRSICANDTIQLIDPT